MNKLFKLTYPLIALNLTMGLLNGAGENPFGEPVNTSNGWKQSSWYGWYVDADYPFVFHAQHDWVYVLPSGNWVWMWDYALNEWFATGGTVYPMLYEAEGDNWLWYYEGTQTPRWYVEMDSSEIYTEFDGILMPRMMKGGFDTAMSLSGGGSEIENLMSEGLGLAMLALLGDPATSTCPQISRTPEEINLFGELPPNIVAGLDFGSGCTPDDGSGVLAGSMDVTVSELSLTETGLGLSIVLEANDLTRDDLLLLDGSLGAGISLEMSSLESETSTHYVTENNSVISGNLSFTDLHSLNQFISGALTLTGTLVTTERELKSDSNDITESTEGTLTLGMTNFSTESFVITSGTATITLAMPGTTTIAVDMQTDQGPINMTLEVDQSDDATVTNINTVGTATIFGYSMTISNLLMDESQCVDYPISGDIIINDGGLAYVVTVSGNCDGDFTISKG